MYGANRKTRAQFVPPTNYTKEFVTQSISGTGNCTLHCTYSQADNQLTSPKLFDVNGKCWSQRLKG